LYKPCKAPVEFCTKPLKHPKACVRCDGTCVLARTTLMTQHEDRAMHYLPHIFLICAGGASLMVFVTSSMF
jgi:hypothetical protein